MKNKKLLIVFCSVILLMMLGSCPTPYLNLPIVDTYIDRMLKEYDAQLIGTLEFENGNRFKLPSSTSSDEPGAIWENSSAASGGKYIKNVAQIHGCVELTVPAGISGSFTVVIGWSGSVTGNITVTRNPGNADEKIWLNIPYSRNATEWEMADPQTLLIDNNMELKPGDIIRVHNGDNFAAADPSLNYIHLDALFILKKN